MTRLAESENIAEVIIAKQRHGPTGKVKLFFDGSTTKFSDLMQDGGQKS
jgi:replicative DNA helicase